MSVVSGAIVLLGAGPGVGAPPPTTQCAPDADYPAATTPVAFWSTEARCAIVPAGPGGSFGSENFGNKFPGEAAVYMGIVHAAVYDAVVAIEGGYRPYAIALSAPDASPEAAIATATHDTLAGLPALGLGPGQQAILDGDYTAYLNSIADGPEKGSGIEVGRKVAAAVLALRTNDGLDESPTVSDLDPPSPGPGVWQPGAGTVLGLRLPGVEPLALTTASQLRPDGPSSLDSKEYADDLNQVEQLGRADSTARTAEQTAQALFWTDHDIRQWNDGLLRLASERGLDLVQTARMLAMAHVAGGDAMIACFDAKYHYWFWRPFQAIPQADADGNPDTTADPTWRPLGATPNFPEYPSAHACHSTAVVEALDAFFGTDRVPFALDSRVTDTTRHYDRLEDIVDDVDSARVLVGFHFFGSDLEGSALGRDVGRYVADHDFQPSTDGNVTCSNLQLNGTIVTGNLTVAPGSWCDLVDVTVDGNLQVRGGSGLRLTGSTVHGNVQAHDVTGAADPLGSGTNAICDTAIDGNLQILSSGPSSPWLIGGCGPVTVSGNLQFQSNAGTGNTIVQTTVRGNLECRRNHDVSGSGNTVAGNRQGQCAGLAPDARAVPSGRDAGKSAARVRVWLDESAARPRGDA
jgi:hypothetical protein